MRLLNMMDLKEIGESVTQISRALLSTKKPNSVHRLQSKQLKETYFWDLGAKPPKSRNPPKP